MIPGYARVICCMLQTGQQGELLGIEEDYAQPHQMCRFPAGNVIYTPSCGYE